MPNATVALVNPQLVTSTWGRGLRPGTLEDALPRPALTMLSAVLKAAGHQVVLADLRLLPSWQAYRDVLARHRPDVVAVTAHSIEAGAAVESARHAKDVLPGCRTVAGGIHFTMAPESAGDAFDTVVRGEGELVLPGLVDQARPPRQLWGEPAALDALPFEDRALYPDHVWRARFPLWDLKPPTMHVLTGRGCPFACRFCCGPGEQNLYTRASTTRPDLRVPALRRRSVAHVLEELRVLNQTYGFRSIVFHDDQFLLDPAWVLALCRGLHDAGHVRRGVRWWAACRADLVRRHPAVLAEMAGAGLGIVSIGFESFSDRLLTWLGKGTTREDNLEAARICRRLGLDIFANVMLGVPGEDGIWRVEDDIASVEALERMRPRWVSPAVFTPMPGSMMEVWCREQGLVMDPGAERAGSRSPGGVALLGVDRAALEPLLGRLGRLGAHPLLDRAQRLRFRLAAGRPRVS